MLGRDDFLGNWQISRQITDRRADQRGSLVGTAVFRVGDANGLQYDEAGQFQLGQAAPMQATRRYHWFFEDGAVRVTFAAGEPFHSFIPSDQSSGTDHLCSADMYRVHYDFRAWPDWSARWDVTGPAKDYTMQTLYRRD